MLYDFYHYIITFIITFCYTDLICKIKTLNIKKKCSKLDNRKFMMPVIEARDINKGGHHEEEELILGICKVIKRNFMTWKM